MPIGLVDKGFRDEFCKASKFSDSVRRAEEPGLLLCFELFKSLFGFHATQQGVFLFGIGQVADHTPTTDESMAHRRFSAAEVGGNGTVSKGLQHPFLKGDGLIDGSSCW